MRILVIGGTGQIGRPLVAVLRTLGVQAVAAARRAGDGGIAVDMRDAAALAEAARGFDTAYLTTPLGPDETAIGLGAVEALRRAGVRKIVYLAIQNLEAMAEIPHFATKVPVKQAVLADGYSVVLGPNFFQTNDRLFADAIRFAGVYPLPVGGAGVWSVHPDDIAAAAANALTRSDWDGQAVPVCGPERLTGEGYAASWAAALGRPVRYAGDAVPPFIAGLRAAMPGMSPWMIDDFETMMRVTQVMGCSASEDDLAASRAIVGRDPIAHSDFARTAAAAWAAEQEKAA